MHVQRSFVGHAQQEESPSAKAHHGVKFVRAKVSMKTSLRNRQTSAPPPIAA